MRIYIDLDPEKQGALCVSTLRSQTVFSSTCDVMLPLWRKWSGLHISLHQASGRGSRARSVTHLENCSTTPLDTIWFLHRCAGAGEGDRVQWTNTNASGASGLGPSPLCLVTQAGAGGKPETKECGCRWGSPRRRHAFVTCTWLAHECYICAYFRVATLIAI